jgi:hypothetical protein
MVVFAVFGFFALAAAGQAVKAKYAKKEYDQ